MNQSLYRPEKPTVICGLCQQLDGFISEGSSVGGKRLILQFGSVPLLSSAVDVYGLFVFAFSESEKPF